MSRIVIVGAGLSGSLLALYLGRLGHHVEVHERRGDPRGEAGATGNRSINLGLSKRGIDALAKAGVLDQVLARAVPMRGRVVHPAGKRARYQPYGVAEDQILHSIERHDLGRILIEAAEKASSTVRFHFHRKLEHLDCEAPAATFRDGRTGESHTVKANLVIGADGAYSATRGHLREAQRADYHQEFLEWGYKELTIPARPDGTAAVRIDALHVWPSDQGLIVAHPNRDNSLTATLFLALEGAPSFAELDSEGRVADYFGRNFPEAVPLMPGLMDEFLHHPVGTLVTVRTSSWHHDGKVALVGDACHAVYPFYGQGMNSSLEDCATLVDCLTADPDDWAHALARYQDARKPNTDVLADLSRQNFFELRDRTRSPLHLLRAKVDLALNRVFPKAWIPLYTMVSHTDIPYAVALTRARRQDSILTVAFAGLGAAAIASVWALTR